MFTWFEERQRRRKAIEADADARARTPSAVAQRAPARAADECLSPICHAWVKALPQAIRPYELCLQFPRVANRLALCWPDPALAQRLCDDLLVDRRGGRRGFPWPVRKELVALRVRLGSDAPAIQGRRSRAPVRGAGPRSGMAPHGG